MVFRPGDHADSPIRAVPRRIRRNITYGVLITNVSCDALANRDHLVELAGEESLSAGRPRQASERPSIPIRIVFVEDADSVNHGARLLGQLQNLWQSGFAGVIPPIADHD